MLSAGKVGEMYGVARPAYGVERNHQHCLAVAVADIGKLIRKRDLIGSFLDVSRLNHTIHGGVDDVDEILFVIQHKAQPAAGSKSYLRQTGIGGGLRKGRTTPPPGAPG